MSLCLGSQHLHSRPASVLELGANSLTLIVRHSVERSDVRLTSSCTDPLHICV